MLITIAFDFDGTIVYNDFPEIGALKPHVVEVMNWLRSDGYKIIINTCRTGEHEQQARECLDNNNIPYDAINANIPEVIEQYPIESRKISADLYIDDRNLGGVPDDWYIIYELIIEWRKNRDMVYKNTAVVSSK